VIAFKSNCSSVNHHACNCMKKRINRFTCCTDSAMKLIIHLKSAWRKLSCWIMLMSSILSVISLIIMLATVWKRELIASLIVVAKASIIRQRLRSELIIKELRMFLKCTYRFSFQQIDRKHSYTHVLQYLSTSMIIACVHCLHTLLLLQLFILHLYSISWKCDLTKHDFYALFKWT